MKPEAQEFTGWVLSGVLTLISAGDSKVLKLRRSKKATKIQWSAETPQISHLFPGYL
jgi:prophage antirepressor-like protein